MVVGRIKQKIKYSFCIYQISAENHLTTINRGSSERQQKKKLPYRGKRFLLLFAFKK